MPPPLPGAAGPLSAAGGVHAAEGAPLALRRVPPRRARSHSKGSVGSAGLGGSYTPSAGSLTAVRGRRGIRAHSNDSTAGLAAAAAAGHVAAVGSSCAAAAEAQQQLVPRSRGGSLPGSATGLQPRGGQPLTKEMLLEGIKATKTPKEDVARFLSRVTHLHLQGQHLGPHLGGLLETVAAVTVVYAYDNLLCGLEGLEHLRHLQMLFLQNNRIVSMSGLESLTHLRKLHLGHNKLARVEGLHGCTQLEELHVPHQFPPPSGVHDNGLPPPLELCARSMAAIADTLQVLDVEGNRLNNLSCLGPFPRLRSLNLANNELHLGQDVRALLSGEYLAQVQLKGNPLATQERKYRSLVVLLTPAVEEIDGRPVLPAERDFVCRLEEQKRRVQAQRMAHMQRQRASNGSSPVQASPMASVQGGSSSTGGLLGGGSSGEYTLVA